MHAKGTWAEPLAAYELYLPGPSMLMSTPTAFCVVHVNVIWVTEVQVTVFVFDENEVICGPTATVVCGGPVVVVVLLDELVLELDVELELVVLEPEALLPSSPPPATSRTMMAITRMTAAAPSP